MAYKPPYNQGLPLHLASTTAHPSPQIASDKNWCTQTQGMLRPCSIILKIGPKIGGMKDEEVVYLLTQANNTETEDFKTSTLSTSMMIISQD